MGGLTVPEIRQKFVSFVKLVNFELLSFVFFVRENHKRWHAWTCVIVPVCVYVCVCVCLTIPPNSTRAKKTQLRIQWLIGTRRTGSSSCEDVFRMIIVPNWNSSGVAFFFNPRTCLSTCVNGLCVCVYVSIFQHFLLFRQRSRLACSIVDFLGR